jgi:hypothetical protein
MADKRFPTLDVDTLSFPSDDLTIGALRKARPELFDRGVNALGEQPRFFCDPEVRGHSEEELGGMLYVERLVALHAYGLQAGVRIEPPTGFTLDELKEELAERYVRYGLAAGLHQAAELIKGVERQARALANAPGR